MNDCQDCKGTGFYVGLIDREPCRTCQSFTPADARREAIKQAEHWATPEFTKVHSRGCSCRECIPWFHDKKDHVAGLKERGLVTDDLHVGRDGSIKAHPSAEPCPARFMLGAKYSECAPRHYAQAQTKMMLESLRSMKAIVHFKV